MHWQVDADWAELLVNGGSLRLEEWMRQGQGQVVKHGPHRTVYRIDLPEKSFFVKHDRSRGWLRALRGLFRASAARREHRQALAIAQREVPTVRPVALGEQTRAGLVLDSYLITEAIAGAQSLDDFLARDEKVTDPAARAAQRRQVLIRLARLCADAHRAGVVHDDFHAGNILVQFNRSISGTAEQPALHLIDLPGVQLRRALDWRASRDSLVMLNSGCLDKVSDRERARFWREYLQHRPDLGRIDARRAGAEIVARSSRYALRNLRRRDERAVRNNRDFQIIRRAWGQAHAVRDLDASTLAAILDDPEALFLGHLHHPLKISHGSVVVRIDLPLSSKPSSLVVKRIRAKTWWKRLLAVVRGPRVLGAWRIGQALRQRGIATARPLAVSVVQRSVFQREGYLVTEWVADAQNLHLYAWQLAKRPASDRQGRARQAAAGLGELLGRMHRWNVSHRDLKGCNLLFVERPDRVEACLVDLDGVRLARRLSLRSRARQLARLATSLQAHDWITRADRLRFLRAYLRASADRNADWKAVWQEVAWYSERHVRRLKRRARPVV